MENKLSAVEWLEDSFRMNFNKIFVDTDFGLISHLIKQAKQMERSQIEKSYCDGFDDGYLLANGEDTKFDDCYLYYNETYGK